MINIKSLVLSQSLVAQPASLRNFTHVILDEVHERDLDADLLSLILKLLTKDHSSIKLVIMSATIQGSLFLRYMYLHESSGCFSTFFVNWIYLGISYGSVLCICMLSACKHLLILTKGISRVTVNFMTFR